MAPLTYILLGTQVLSALLLIVLILLHSPKSDGVLGAGVSQFFASQKGAEASLTRITAICAGVFALATFVTGYYM
jgi:preprotein translocase subunit SecG